MLLTSLVIGGTLVYPNYQDLTELKVDINLKQSELVNKTRRVSELARLKEQLDRHTIELERIDAAIPQDAEIPTLFNFIQNISATSGLVLRFISAAETEGRFENSDLVVVSISISVTGSYDALKEYISQIEKSPRILEIQSVAFSSLLSEDEQFDFTISFNAYAY